MHPRNPHQQLYNFPELVQVLPQLKRHIILNKRGEDSINFDDTESVRVLNQAILAKFYGIKDWIIPPQFLCPPIPGRADYIHTLTDLFPKNQFLKGLDIGTGASCIYPLIGFKSYGWSFVGTDIDPEAMKSAQNIIHSNGLEKAIELRLQSEPMKIFDGIINAGEYFDFSLCNPPFHASAEEAQAGTDRKRKNLGLPKTGKLNFGGRGHELWCEGGERSFVMSMIEESTSFTGAVNWFTVLISKEANIIPLQKKLKEIKCMKVKILEMTLGQKKSRILAWSFKK